MFVRGSNVTTSPSFNYLPFSHTHISLFLSLSLFLYFLSLSLCLSLFVSFYLSLSFSHCSFFLSFSFSLSHLYLFSYFSLYLSLYVSMNLFLSLFPQFFKFLLSFFLFISMFKGPDSNFRRGRYIFIRNRIAAAPYALTRALFLKGKNILFQFHQGYIKRGTYAPLYLIHKGHLSFMSHGWIRLWLII